MDYTENRTSLDISIGNRLQRIANVLLINSSFIDNPGLLNGKMGIAIFLYNYSRYLGSRIFTDYANELIDEIYQDLNINTPLDFANGLTGIGWGIEYLVKNSFVEADTDEALSEIDNLVYRNSLNRPFLLENDKDLFGYGIYYIARLRVRENDDDNLNTLFKKQHLIYLTDDVERILTQKEYLKFNIVSLSTDTINSILFFLLEMHRIRLFPIKVEKLFHSLPEFIELGQYSSNDKSAQSLLHQLTEKIIPCISDKALQSTFRKILKKADIKVTDINSADDNLADQFIKYSWQQLIYAQYIKEDYASLNNDKRVFSIIDNEGNWNWRLDNLNKNNLGLDGLAGIGLGFLNGRIKDELRTGKSEIRMQNNIE
jgi:hypothetical protein